MPGTLTPTGTIPLFLQGNTTGQTAANVRQLVFGLLGGITHGVLFDGFKPTLVSGKVRVTAGAAFVASNVGTYFVQMAANTSSGTDLTCEATGGARTDDILLTVDDDGSAGVVANLGVYKAADPRPSNGAYLKLGTATINGSNVITGVASTRFQVGETDPKSFFSLMATVNQHAINTGSYEQMVLVPNFDPAGQATSSTITIARTGIYRVSISGFWNAPSAAGYLGIFANLNSTTATTGPLISQLITPPSAITLNALAGGSASNLFQLNSGDVIRFWQRGSLAGQISNARISVEYISPVPSGNTKTWLDARSWTNFLGIPLS
jgi:hypothetical protein